MTMPPSNSAVVGEPGMPSVSIGKRDPVEAAIPSMLPLPKPSRSFDVSFARPYAGAGPAGRQRQAKTDHDDGFQHVIAAKPHKCREDQKHKREFFGRVKLKRHVRKGCGEKREWDDRNGAADEKSCGSSDQCEARFALLRHLRWPNRGACPVWNIHNAFAAPGAIVPQFVELPDSGQFFTISRTTNRPVINRHSGDRRLVVTLGCERAHVTRVGYAAPFNLADDTSIAKIGINCHICPRQACSQRAHEPVHVNLHLDANRRGSTRYES